MTEETRHPAFSDFVNSLQSEKERRAHRCDDLRQHIKNSPVTAEVRDAIQWLGPTEQEDVLTHHPGYILDRKLNSLWSMLAVFQEAHIALVEQVENLHAFSKTEAMHLPEGRAMLDHIEVRLRKELVAFSAAAAALEAFSRRVNSSFKVNNYCEQIATMFDLHEHQFVKELRNVICHQEFPYVHWQISYGPSAHADFILPTRSLEAMGSFKAGSLEFLKRWPDGICLRSLADTYAERVTSFYTWLRDQMDKESSAVLDDYRSILRTCRANAVRCTFRVIWQQIQGKEVDPYKHLHRYLFPDDLKAALAMPVRSKEQVDFIIARADEHGACNDEIRQKIYQLFGVESIFDRPDSKKVDRSAGST